MEYQGWVNPYGASIGDTIARSGDAAAHAAEMIAQANARAEAIKGATWAGAIQNVANLPMQIEQTRDAAVTRKLKQQELEARSSAMQEQMRARAVLDSGRLAGASETPDQFLAGVDSLGLPAPVAAHMKQTVAAAGPDGWPALRQQYTGFASQYQEATKLGKGDQLVKPSLMPGGKPTIVADNPENKPLVLRPGDVAVPEAGGTPIASAPFAPGTGQHVVNGQVVDATGAPVGAAVPKQEGASEVAVNNARVDQINKGIEKIDNEIAGSMPMTAKDRAELAIQRQRLETERLHYKTIENGQDINSPKNQEHLEQSYQTLLKTTQSSRSGGLGLEDKKVDQAKHLLTLIDQQKDASGQYHITPTQQAELSIGLATLLSPTGAPSDHTIQLINQATAEGDLAKAFTYVTGTPVKGTPQDLAQLLRDSIERQGVQAETNREGHFNQLRAFAPTDLSPERRERLERGLIGANRLSVEVNVPGAGAMRFPTQTAADKFVAAARAKGLMQ